MSFAQSLVEVLRSVPYNSAFSEGISRVRETQSILGIDILLEQCHIGGKYPPSDKTELQSLCASIEKSDSISASRALLYLLIECSTEDANAAQYYISQTWMDPAEQSLVKALFTLDKGKSPEEALELLGEPCFDQGLRKLNSHIFGTLFKQNPQLALEFAESIADTNQLNNSAYVEALALQGKFFEILLLSRRDNKLGYLETAAFSGVENPQHALALSQLACTEKEWEAIQLTLDSVSGPKAELAQRILLVRAVHTGDDKTAKRLGEINRDVSVVSKVL